MTPTYGTLTEFYYKVEALLVDHFGDHNRAVAWFEWNRGRESLWAYVNTRWVAGWTPEAVARGWFYDIVGKAQSAVEAGEKPVVSDPILVSAKVINYESPVEPEILEARKNRRMRWEKVA